jgi:hypothetical protein
MSAAVAPAAAANCKASPPLHPTYDIKAVSINLELEASCSTAGQHWQHCNCIAPLTNPTSQMRARQC